MVLISCIATLSLFNIVDIQNLRTLVVSDKKENIVKMKQHILCIMMAYPEYITDLKLSENGNIYLIMKSGRKILYDDGKSKSPEEKISDPDLEDMMEPIYPLGKIDKLMDSSFNPGRIRIYTLLKEVYGEGKKEVEKNLDNINTYYGHLQFNRNNNASLALKSVMDELIPLAQSRADIKACLAPYSGTFNYRNISGTDRLSPHAFGIAIDLAYNENDYWQWSSRKQGQERLKSYPKEIVEIFEKNNFIWGGKWGHFDILHFEYRPEIIMMSRFFGNKNNNPDFWYDGAPIENDQVKSYIKKIDEVFDFKIF